MPKSHSQFVKSNENASQTKIDVVTITASNRKSQSLG